MAKLEICSHMAIPCMCSRAGRHMMSVWGADFLLVTKNGHILLLTSYLKAQMQASKVKVGCLRDGSTSSERAKAHSSAIHVVTATVGLCGKGRRSC